jgi:pimeloyl-ACP methyl ester carboxylesterase
MTLPKLLLLHGALGSATLFDELKQILEVDFDILTFNFPGHGGKQIPVEPFSFSLFASAILDFLDDKKIENIDIFGYSMGGYAALWLAKENPSRVKKIFTLATKMDWNEVSSEREASMLNPLKIEEKIPAFAKVLEERHSPSDWKEVVSKTREMILNLGRHHLEEKDFRAIKQSVVIGVGEKDNMVSMDESRKIATLLSRGKFLGFPGMQHPFEKADLNQLAPAIKSFFNGNQ